MSKLNSTVSSPDAVLQTLKWARKQGFKPVALRYRSKAAISENYADLKYKPPDDDFWRANLMGIGIVTGPRQGGPVDIDLDCPEAVFFAARFLPETQAVFGRSSKRCSHYLYRVNVDAFRSYSFNDPVLNNAHILEMRADGLDRNLQTVFPGSLHEDTGEPIGWEKIAFPEITNVDAFLLHRRCRMVGIAVLIVRYMWEPGFHNEPTKHLSGLLCRLDWTQEEVTEIIRAVMDYTGDTDKSRIPTIGITFRRDAAELKTSGAGVLRKQLKEEHRPAVDRLLEFAGSPAAGVLLEYNERFAAVMFEGKFRIADTNVLPSEPPLFYQKDDFLAYMAVDYSPEADEKGKRQSKAKHWLSSPQRRQYNSVDFSPGTNLPGVLNLWTGWGVEPQEGKCTGWLRLLREIICDHDEELYVWMLHWFANILREPRRKPPTAPVMIGPEGAGKTLLLSYFGKILGSCYVPVTKDDHIHGRFNRHTAMALLIHSEEALFGGDKKHAGITRSLITDDFVVFERKGIDAKLIRNYARLVLTTNEDHAAAAKPGDRRYTVLQVNKKIPDQLRDETVAELEGDGPSALHHFLINMDYDPTLPRVNIKNKALADLKRTNSTPLEDWWQDALESGQPVHEHAFWTLEGQEGDLWTPYVSSNAMHASMRIFFETRGVTRQIPSPTYMALQLNKFTGRVLNRVRRRYENPRLDYHHKYIRELPDRQYAITNMPPLDHCRQAFEAYLGQPVEWLEVDREGMSPPQENF